jgi:hypothetical protein
MSDDAAAPAPGVDGIDTTVVEAADAATAAWFPHIRRGAEDGQRSLLEHYGRRLVGVRIEVTRVHAHPVATTASACRRYGREFILSLGRHRSVPISGPIA